LPIKQPVERFVELALQSSYFSLDAADAPFEIVLQLVELALF
jgi:hypothetical protein